MKIGIVIMLIAFFIVSCEQSIEKVEDVQTKSQETEIVEEPEQIETDESIIASIDSYRQRLENEIGEPLEIKSDQLREKTKQKWEKIHFYVQEGKVVRIKSYPHEGLSERTEEFYLKDNQLILDVIEDHGMSERGKEIEEIDKIYYFNNDNVIKEVGSENESEFAVKNSDGEELLSEVKEYLKVYKEKVEKMIEY
jgi:hypothetical protein